MTDDMLRAVAKNGGVVQVNFFNAFIDEDFRKAFTRNQRSAMPQLPRNQRSAKSWPVRDLSDIDRIDASGPPRCRVLRSSR